MARIALKSASAELAHRKLVARFARTGYVAKGVTYLLMGLLALRAALGYGSAANTSRAMTALDGPLIGKIALSLIALGLAAYALWKLYEGLANPEDDSWNQRVGAVFIAFVNGGLAVQAALLVVRTARGSSTRDQAVQWSARAMELPMGRWALGAVGLSIAGYGLWQLYRGVVSKLDSQLRLRRMDEEARGPAVLASRFGIAARGFVFVLIGIFVAKAALERDASEASDFGHSMERLQEQPYGSWLLGVVAVGLFAYAVYEFLRAKYRQIPTV